MTPEAQRIAIAEACGWTRIGTTGNHGIPYGEHPIPENRSKFRLDNIPDFCADLNAMYEAVQTMNDADWERFLHHCETIIARGESKRGMTAPQACEAFLRANSKWEESK